MDPCPENGSPVEPTTNPRTRLLRSFRGWLALLGGLLAWSCNGGGGGGPQGPFGVLAEKPGGGSFFVDPHQGGGASRLRLRDVSWGRLVDVHDVDAAGEPRPEPALHDVLIQETLQSGVDHVLETNPITRRTRLVIRRTREVPDDGTGTFEDLLRGAVAQLPRVEPRATDDPSGRPYSLVPRNATLMLRFDDLLDDGTEAALALRETVRLMTGYPPNRLFEARVFFDPNHGGLDARGNFRSTRVLVDLTVSEVELSSVPFPLAVNALGLPASLTETPRANVSLLLPTREDPSSGQFHVLRSISGKPLSTLENGPVDGGSGTVDVVRAVRAGNGTDPNNGFLLDLNPPRVVGRWPVLLGAVLPDAFGLPGFDFLADVTFLNDCMRAARPGDVLGLGDHLVEVVEPSSPPTPGPFEGGTITGLRLRLLASTPLGAPDLLLGSGDLFTVFDGPSSAPGACWYRFDPPPSLGPMDGVSPSVRIGVGFSEPMEPTSVSAFDSLRVSRGLGGDPIEPLTSVVGTIGASPDLREFDFVPQTDLDHVRGRTETFHVEVVGGPRGVTDLSGNSPPDLPPVVEFRLDAGAETLRTGGFVLRFEDQREFDVDDPDPQGSVDLRGQFFYDFERGVIFPRQPMRSSWSADASNPVPGLMSVFPPGVQTPISPLGSKLHQVWRYCDFGWLVEDESKFNLDVEGIYWSPITGLALSDFYERFEIRLAHSKWLPDEFMGLGLLVFSSSGLVSRFNPYEDNLLLDPLSPQVTVHPGPLGYLVDPSDLTASPAGVPLMPYPMNRGGGPYASYTWRDTAVLAKGGEFGAGIPLHIEKQVGLYGALQPGDIARPGDIPSFALPLLMEFRCYPSDSSIGLNSLDIRLASTASPNPNFRSYSTGGIDASGGRVVKDPDLQPRPSGGFNPNSNPPGRPTRQQADNSFYVGQLDTVVRVSRAHTIWLRAGAQAPDYLTPVLEPAPDDLPEGTRVELDFRGADTFFLGAEEPFDAESLDPYGDPRNESVPFYGDVATWTSDIDDVDGAPYIQVRISFVNDVAAGVTPELAALGIAHVGP